MLAVVIWWLAVVQSENISNVEPGEASLVEQVEKLRTQTIKLFNNTDVYEMATTMSGNVADTLKLFDTLGTLFRNGTLATYMRVESDGPLEQRYYEIYALPNGSVPLKKSVIKLIYDVYNMTQVKDGDLEDQHVAEELSYTWFPKRAGKDVYERYDNEFLAQFAYEGMNCR
ncbi:hypothetical protein AAVH_15466 [Aphelenchoides avenae]|nr:hypothetical protein AAVH_15466 [Aphelenchus avenae]